MTFFAKQYFFLLHCDLTGLMASIEFYNYANFRHIRSDVLLSGRAKTAEYVAWVVDKEAANSRREYITEILCV